MKNIQQSILIFLGIFTFFQPILAQKSQQPVYQDKPYWQDYSIKYFLNKDQNSSLINAESDRNGNIILMSSRSIIQEIDVTLAIKRCILKKAIQVISKKKK